jgi:hypothetical protein
MLFIISFEDHADRLHIREQEMANHKQFLVQNEDKILGAGSLRDAPDDRPVGAMWIVKADDRVAAEAVFQSDPFWVKGLRKSYKILRWAKAIERERLI